MASSGFERSFEQLPRKELERAITNVRALQARGVGVDDLMIALQPVFRGWKLTAPVFDPGIQIFRGRKVSGPLREELTQYIYPPVSRAHLNRANREGVSLFYGSTAREAVLFELRAEVGDEVAVVHFETTSPMMLMSLGYTSAVAESRKSVRPVPAYGDDDSDESNRVVTEFLSELFTSDHPGRDYLTSIAVAEKMLTADMVHGLVYPSLAMYANADNVALRPAFVDAALRPVYAERLKITEREGMTFRVDVVDEAWRIRGGRLKWLGHLGQWQMPPGGELTMTAVNGRWVARDQRGRIVEPT